MIGASTIGGWTTVGWTIVGWTIGASMIGGWMTEASTTGVCTPKEPMIEVSTIGVLMTAERTTGE